MRQLLCSHEQDIVDRVLLQLCGPNPITANHPPTSPQQFAREPQIPQIQQSRRTLGGIVELGDQLAALTKEMESGEGRTREPRALGTYFPAEFPIGQTGESAASPRNSIEVLFPGVEGSTLTQIVENRFKPTNIYPLLASETERAESQRTISKGGVEFEQAERDGKESEYGMSSFFKAWAAYCCILVQLAPHLLQADLATSLSIYTMNLYELLEKYTWEGVKAYHFQFHVKRVASAKSIYHPGEWRLLDSKLIASKCFAYPVARSTWIPSQKALFGPNRRVHKLSRRDHTTFSTTPYQTHTPSAFFGSADRRTSGNKAIITAAHVFLLNPGALTIQGCRNWNYRECCSAQCRYQHACITCGSNHKAAQCHLHSNGPVNPPSNLSHRR